MYGKYTAGLWKKGSVNYMHIYMLFTCILPECFQLSYAKLDEINQLWKKISPTNALFDQQMLL